MIWLASSPEARFQALVTLIGGVIVILGAIGGLVWRAGRWIRRQEDATRTNTQAIDEMKGATLTNTRAIDEMKGALDELRHELSSGGTGRRRR